MYLGLLTADGDKGGWDIRGICKAPNARERCIVSISAKKKVALGHDWKLITNILIY